MSLLKSRFIEMFGDVINNKKTWPTKRWSDVLNIVNGKNQKKVECENGIYPICGSGGGIGKTNEYLTKENSVIIGRKGNINNPILMKTKFWNVDTAFGLEPNNKEINVEYLYKFCELFDFQRLNKTVTIPSLTKSDLLKIEIPVPPMKLQEEYRNFLAQVDKSKFLLQQILEKFELLKKSRFIEMFGNVATNNKRWEKTKLGNKSVIGSSKRIFANEYTTEGIPFYRSKEIIELGMGEKPSVELYISKKRYQEIKEKFGIPIPGDILMTAVGTIGKFWIVPNSKPFYYKDGNLVYIRTKEFNPLFLKKLLEMLIEKYKVENANGSAYTALTIEKLKDLQIVLPPMTLQKQYEEFHIQIDKSKLIIQKALEDLVGKV